MTWLKKLLGAEPEDGDISLDDLGVLSDPGTEWHPDKPLNDLSDAEVEEHMLKPERLVQTDAGQVLDHDGEDEGTN